jgi:phage-related protein
VKEFIASQSVADRAAIIVYLERVAQRGLAAARQLRGEIYEVRIAGDRQSFRVLFATDGRYSQVLLALEAFSKKTQKTPPEKIALAEERLADWRERGKRSNG